MILPLYISKQIIFLLFKYSVNLSELNRLKRVNCVFEKSIIFVDNMLKIVKL